MAAELQCPTKVQGDGMGNNKSSVVARRLHQVDHFTSLAECADLTQVSGLDLVVVHFDINDYSVLLFCVLLSRYVDLNALITRVLAQSEYQVADHLRKHRQVHSHALRGGYM